MNTVRINSEPDNVIDPSDLLVGEAGVNQENGHVILRTFDSLVDLDYPGDTWTMPSSRPPFRVRKLAPGTELSITLGEANLDRLAEPEYPSYEPVGEPEDLTMEEVLGAKLEVGDGIFLYRHERDEVNEHLKSGQKILAIRTVRGATGLGLKEAKYFVDAFTTY